MNRPLKRLLTGASLLGAVLLLALTATTSVFAFHVASTPSSSSNAGPLNLGGSAVPSAVTPGTPTTYTSNYSYSIASTPTGLTASSQSTTIGTMVQQWRNNTYTDRWFYLFAVNANQGGSAASPAAGVNGVAANSNLSAASFTFYYYSKEGGSTLFTSSPAAGSTGATLGTLATAQAGVSGIVMIKSNQPAATVLNMNASVPACAGAAGTRCTASFETSVRWGLAQEAWPGGSSTLLQAVESVPLLISGSGTSGVPSNAGTVGAVTYVDAYNNPLTLTLTDAAPTAGAVTNLGTVASPGARQVNVSYSFAQSIADTNGDAQSGSLIFVFTSGASNGQWFTVGYTNGDNNDNTISVAQANATCWYQSWNESLRTAQGCSPITGNYVTSYVGSGAGSASAETITHTITFSTPSIGGVTVYGRAEDVHGGTSGNVQAGALTIS